MSHTRGRQIVPASEGDSNRLGKLCGRYQQQTRSDKTFRETTVLEAFDRLQPVRSAILCGSRAGAAGTSFCTLTHTQQGRGGDKNRTVGTSQYPGNQSKSEAVYSIAT